MNHDRGRLIDDRFEIEALWGTFGVSRLYRARDRETGGAVLVKLAPGVAPERFHHESVVLAGLDHPRIVRHIAHGTTPEGEPYLVTEDLEGVDLEGRLWRLIERSAPTMEESLTIARGTAEALAAAHASGIVHRDIKPGHLFLCGGDIHRVKLINFELAGRVDTPMPEDEIFGNPAYMAPEQMRGEPRIDTPADIFALGCVLFECLTGRLPFIAPSTMALVRARLYGDAPRLAQCLPDAPPALDALLARMMARDPAQRPRDGAALLAELDRLDAELRHRSG